MTSLILGVFGLLLGICGVVGAIYLKACGYTNKSDVQDSDSEESES